MTESDIVLVNDLDSLREAVEVLGSMFPYDTADQNGESAVDTITTLVPRLIKSYEDVLEASFELTRLVELMNENRTPEGLYLP